MCDVTSAKSAIISVSDKVGSLKEVCELFEKHGFNMTSIQSRPSPSSSQGYDFFIDFETTKKDDEVNALVKELEGKTSSVTILTKGQTKSEVSLSTSASGVRTKGIHHRCTTSFWQTTCIVEFTLSDLSCAGRVQKSLGSRAS